ncbi:MAG: rhodanese-like domain-containing protein, partial [Fermentimonas sp.]
YKGVSSEQLKERLKEDKPIFMIDVRNPGEFEEMRLGIGERLIPLGQLRNRLSELPEDKSIEIITWCKISLRGYEAALILQANGYKNVKVLEGGIAAWPWNREE